MKLFEVIRWGNDSDDPLAGGPDGPDTCFLVHAASVEDAARLVGAQLALSSVNSVKPYASAIHLISEVSSSEQQAIIRGPYIQHAYRHGWRAWYRNDPGKRWIESAGD